ncbi:MAG: dipeptidase [Chloroflexota bacterium]|nr:dipeptidase [Chloroflexota bacterium]
MTEVPIGFDNELIPIFDGHNDTLLSLSLTGRSFFTRSETGHVDLPRARAGGMVGGFFAVFVPNVESVREKANDLQDILGTTLKGVPLETEQGPSLPYAQQITFAQVARLLRLEMGVGNEVEPSELNAEIDGEQADALAIVWTAEELRERIARRAFSAILHVEGAEMIDTNFYALETLHAAGLRSLGIVWSRSNAFGHGVPFAFPADPDTGPGLTDAGKALVGACNNLGILIDLSHLNERGFWDVAALTDVPLVATHSNAHALCPSARNLTDKQLAAIRESNGVVGVNFNVGFLRPDGARQVDTPLEVMADHVDYLVDKLGIDGVALGSDFDGALMPTDLSDCAKLPNLTAVLRARGYDDAALHRIGHENWLRVLAETWGA